MFSSISLILAYFDSRVLNQRSKTACHKADPYELTLMAGLRQSAISNVNDANAIYAAFQFLVGPD
jgi:hypothetical protein